MENGEEVPGLLEVDSAMVAVGGGDIDIGCGNAFGGAGEDEGADDSVQKENNVSGPSSFNYTVSHFKIDYLFHYVWSLGVVGDDHYHHHVHANHPFVRAWMHLSPPFFLYPLNLVVQAMPFGSKGEFKTWIKDYVRNLRQALKGAGVPQDEIKK